MLTIRSFAVKSFLFLITQVLITQLFFDKILFISFVLQLTFALAHGHRFVDIGFLFVLIT